MTARLALSTLLFAAAGLAQLTRQDPAGAWKAEQIRLIWQDAGDTMTYRGSLELKGQSFPVYATRRLFGSNFSGSVNSRLAFKAKLDKGFLRISIGEHEFTLERDPDYRPPAVTESMMAPAPMGSAPMGSAPMGSAPMTNSPWVRRLAGQKLQQISTGDYDRSHRVWILHPNGTFSYSGESGGAVYSGGGSAAYGNRSGSAGTWRIMEQGGNAVLILNYRGSGEKTYRLSANEQGWVFLNGVRTYVTGPNEG